MTKEESKAAFTFMKICEDGQRTNIARLKDMIKNASKTEVDFLTNVLIQMEDKLRGMIRGRIRAEKQLKALS